MGDEATIKMPLGTQTARILQVVARCVGSPFYMDSLASQSSEFDATLPCGKDNRWWLRIEKEYARIKPNDAQDLSWGYMLVVDAIGQRWSWAIHPEVETEDGVQVSTRSDILGLALARRLQQVFGGQLVCSDGNDDAPGNVLDVSPAQAQFPPLAPDQDGSDRWYQFQNALKAQAPISVAELEWARTRCAYNDTKGTRLAALQEWLVAEDQRCSMEAQTRSVQSVIKPHRL